MTKKTPAVGDQNSIVEHHTTTKDGVNSGGGPELNGRLEDAEALLENPKRALDILSHRGKTGGVCGFLFVGGAAIAAQEVGPAVVPSVYNKIWVSMQNSTAVFVMQCEFDMRKLSIPQPLARRVEPDQSFVVERPGAGLLLVTAMK